MDGHDQELRFQITGMDCAHCAQTIQTGVAKLPGVRESKLSFTTGTLAVRGAVTAEQVAGRVRELGYDVTDDGQQTTDNNEDAGHGPSPVDRTLLTYLWTRTDTRLALIAALLVIPGLIFDELLPGMGIESPVFAAMSVLAMLLAGAPIARSAWRALRVNHEITINLLMTIAAIGAVIIGAYTEAGLVMVLFALGEALEGYTAARARDSISSLSALAPAEATVLLPSLSGDEPVERRMPVGQLRVGDRVLVLPGERLPVDGSVLIGESAVNQAPITGESRPVEVSPGADVLAGTVNGQGTLEIEVSRLAADTTISRMIRLVAEAQERRAPAQRFVDQFARYYTPAVIAVALLVATIPPLVFGQPFLNPAPDVHGWLYRALALLVVACPCALVISTPVTLVSAISNGARHGVLFKGGAYVEALSRIRAIAFDKTGTITRGEPAVVSVVAADCQDGPGCAPCDDVLALAAAVERRSEHPLARAVVAEATARGVEGRYPAGASVSALVGRGVTGTVGGRAITVGSHAHFEDAEDHAPYHDAIAAADAQGYSTMLVTDNGRYRGYIAVDDALRPGAAEAVAELGQMGVRPLVMLTGDHTATARRVGDTVGLADVRADQLPADKLAAVEKLRTEYGHVAMVGDGINDTPAFAASSVGVAIGRTAQALETADVVLLGDDLRLLPFALRLSRAAMNTVWFNVALSIGIKLIFFLIILFGEGTMWMAVLADMGTSLLVTANGMRLLRRPRPETVLS